MRILIVTQPRDGGVFQHVAQLGAGLAESGHDVAVCGPVGHRGQELGLETFHVDLVRAVAPRTDLVGARKLAAVVRDHRPDVIHAHSSKAGAVARMARPAFPRTPIVYTPHGYAFAGHFDNASQRRAYRIVEQALAPFATRVIGVCEAERRLAASVGAARRTRVVHNGVAPATPGSTHPVVGKLRERGPVLCTVTGLRPGKGIETLIDAMPAVCKAHPHAALVIAGEGSERSALEARIQACAVGHAVHLIGATRGSASVLRGADVFVNPSWAESFPYSVLEAMSMAVPIVTTDVGGTGEAIEHGVTGLLVPPRSSRHLAEALVSLIGESSRARALGAAARDRAARRFTLDAMIQGTLHVYDELAGEGSDRPRAFGSRRPRWAQRKP